MIDIHNHILFGIDDGSSNLEESIKLIEKAISNGYTDLILTPHYRAVQNYVCDNQEKYERFTLLQEEVKKRNLKINLFLGNEITIDDDFFYYLNTEQILFLNDGRYALIELPFSQKYQDLDKAVDKILDCGCIPIIAHPERYDYYQDLSDFQKLLKKGVLFQGNIGSLYGKYGQRAKETLEEMLRKSMIHFMASDIHKESQTSYDRAKDAFEKVIELTRSKKIAQDLFKNNAIKVLKDIRIEPYTIYKKKFKLRLFNF